MKKLYYYFLNILFFVFIGYSTYSQGVVISGNPGDTPDPSAILEVKSTTQGLLIPRMTTAQRNTLSLTAVEGLLIYDTDDEAFYLRGNGDWIDLSSSAEIWSQTASNVFLTNSLNNVGIGTNSPSSKFVIQADEGDADSDILFEVKDKTGGTVMAVTSEGIRMYVKDLSKGVSGGFAIGKYGIAKDKGPGDLFVVTSDSTRVYTDEGAGVSGGFAVGKYGIAKDNSNKYFFTHSDSTRIYTDTGAKGVSGGFAVGKYGAVSGPTENYMHITKDNYFIGHSSGINTTVGAGNDGKYNIFFGYESGLLNTSGHINTFIGHNTGYNNLEGSRNVFMGTGSGYSNQYGSYNLFAGFRSGFSNTGIDGDINAGVRNVFLGYEAGYENTTGSDNILIGYNAGHENTTAGNNICFGTGSGRHNSINSDNIFIGFQAGFYHEGTGVANEAINNIYIGKQAGYADVSDVGQGNDNIFMGTESGFANTTGERNIFLGYQSGIANDIGVDNIFLGTNAGNSNERGNLNIFLGNNSGYNNWAAENNVFIGYSAGYSLNGSTGTDGDFNVFIGNNAGYSNLTGRDNIYIGNNAAYTNTGYYNVIIGSEAGRNSTGNFSTIIGRYAGESDTGDDNTYIGNGSGRYNVTGTDNVVIGSRAAFWATAGNQNVIIGSGAAELSATQSLGSRNIIIGYDCADSQVGISNRLFIENSNTASPLIYGEFDNNYLQINGSLNVNGAYTFPPADGTLGQVLTTNGTGTVSWSTVAGTLVTAGNGLNIEGIAVELGGTLNEATTVTQGNYGMTYNLSGTGDFTIQDNGTTAFRVNDAGNTRVNNSFGINTIDFGGGTQVISITNGTAPSSNCNNGVILFAQDLPHPALYSELRVRDENSNVTTLSPHNFSISKKSEPMAWSFYSENHKFGQKINVDMLKAVRLIEKLSGEKLVYISDLDNNEVNNEESDNESLIKKLEKQQNEINILKNEIKELKELIQK